VNGPAFSMTIPVYQCPSDKIGAHSSLGADWGYGGAPWSLANYVGCFSPDGIFVEADAGYTYSNVRSTSANYALFNFNVKRSIANVIDGTSNTVAVSEVISGPDGSTDIRGCWWDDYGVQYSHKNTPNSPIPDQVWSAAVPFCQSTPQAPCNYSGADWADEIYSARSKHSGGVNVLFVDGSVHFIGNGIDLATWQALGSINGGEVLSGDY
jgi:prepilin-type processing-associated H-X9-DG protein